MPTLPCVASNNAYSTDRNDVEIAFKFLRMTRSVDGDRAFFDLWLFGAVRSQLVLRRLLGVHVG